MKNPGAEEAPGRVIGPLMPCQGLVVVVTVVEAIAAWVSAEGGLG